MKVQSWNLSQIGLFSLAKEPLFLRVPSVQPSTHTQALSLSLLLLNQHLIGFTTPPISENSKDSVNCPEACGNPPLWKRFQGLGFTTLSLFYLSQKSVGFPYWCHPVGPVAEYCVLPRSSRKWNCLIQHPRRVYT
jgi:hypothetical protein